MTNESKLYRLIYSLDRCLTEKYKNMPFEMLRKCSNEFYMENVFVNQIKDIGYVNGLDKLDYFIDKPEELLQVARSLTGDLEQQESDTQDYLIRILEGEQL